MAATKFIHIADLHLGKRQYNNDERYKDYFRAFKWILNLAIREEVDFILIAGDMFDNRKVGPAVLTEVFYLIQNFKNESQEKLNRKIPLICIEGNHDNPIYSKRSWMTFLADLDLIILLSGNFDKNKRTIIFEPYDYGKHRGGMIQIKDFKIYGLPFYGSSTRYLFEPIINAINKDNSVFNILMMHFGIEGEDTSKPGIEYTENFKKLHEKVDYLALGHFHKNYERPKEDCWIFNPGSLEITNIKEVFEYFNNDAKRGVYVVETLGNKLQWKFLECDNGDSNPHQIPNRRFFTIGKIDISSTNTFEESMESILNSLHNYSVPSKDSDMTYNPSDLNCPVIFFNIEGEINYPRLEINIHQIRKEIMEKFSILEVRIFSPYLISSLDEIRITDKEKTIEEIENEVFRALVGTNPHFENIQNEVVQLMKTLKAGMLERQPNYSALKEMVKDWCLQKAKIFDIPSIPTETVAVLEDDEAFLDEQEYDDEFDGDLDDYILDVEDKSKEGD